MHATVALLLVARASAVDYLQGNPRAAARAKAVALMDAIGPSVIAYFVILLIVGAFFVVNLVVAVIYEVRGRVVSESGVVP